MIDFALLFVGVLVGADGRMCMGGAQIAQPTGGGRASGRAGEQAGVWLGRQPVMANVMKM